MLQGGLNLHDYNSIKEGMIQILSGRQIFFIFSFQFITTHNLQKVIRVCESLFPFTPDLFCYANKISRVVLLTCVNMDNKGFHNKMREN